jgi:hypothetical protein
LAASLSDVTAVSSALVAVEIAVSALVIVFADEAAWLAAAFSLAEAEVTLVAAEATVRGVTVVARAVVRLAVLRAALVVPLAPAVVAAAAGFAAPEDFAELAVLVVRARELARPELAIRTGAALAAAFFVGGTDLPPILDQITGGVIPRRVTSYTYSRYYSLLLIRRTRRQQPVHDPQRLVGRGPPPDRDPHQVTGPRHRDPDHVVRDVPGQVEHLAPQVLGQHVRDGNLQGLANPRQPLLNVSHRSSFPSAALPSVEMISGASTLSR